MFRRLIGHDTHSPAVTTFLRENSIGLISGVHYDDIEELLAGKKIEGAHQGNYNQCQPFDSGHRNWAKSTFAEVGISPSMFGSTEDSFRKGAQQFYSDGFARGLSFSGKVEGAAIGRGITDVRPRTTMTDDAGSPWVDVDTQLMREGSACFTAFTRRSKARGKVLSIVCITGGHCGLSGEQLFWSPLVGCRILELARASGIPARMEYMNMCHHNDSGNQGANYGYYTFPVCEANDPIVYESALAIGMGGIFRTFGFMGIMGTTTQVGSGLGYPGQGVELMKKMARHSDKEAIGAMFPDGCVFVDQVTTEEAAEKELNRVLDLIADGLFDNAGIFA